MLITAEKMGGRAREEQTKGDEYPGRKSSLFGHSDF